VDVLLLGSSPEEQSPLRLRLLSDSWSQASAWPPRQLQAELQPSLAGQPREALNYQVSEVEPREDTGKGEGFWQAYLQPGAPAALPGPSSDSGALDTARDEDLLESLVHWLTETLRVDTVGGALRCVEFGDVGVFGPVKRRVLERSGSADMEVEATLLGEASDAEDPGAQATLILELYGDRYGAWLLQRRRLLAANRRRPQGEAVAAYQCDVLVADSVEDLVQSAGLGPIEKQLFQAAGLLPNESFYEHYRQSSDALDDGGAVPAAANVDLSKLPDRSQRYVQALLALAVTGKLSHADLDLLLRVARQLAQGAR
jgi:hypothetical protein